MATASHSRTPGERGLEAFILEHVAEVRPLMRASNEASWRANLSGEVADQEESGRLEARLRSVYSRPEPLAMLLALESAGEIRDSGLQRQLRVLVLAHRSQQIPPDTLERMVRMEKAIEGRFNAFRARFRGRQATDNELRQILRDSNDPDERREAWEASKQVGAEVRDALLELVGLRNTTARRQGFRHFYAMMLELDELDEGELFATLEELDRATRPLFERYRLELDARLASRFGIATGDLRPWHFADPFFQEAPEPGLDLDRWFAGKDLERIAADFFDRIGFDIGDILARSDLYERPGKCQHAFCTNIDRRLDIRVLCNVRPTERWMGTLLHELGHAVYDQNLDPALPFLLRSHSHLLTTEASAMLLGRLSRNGAWLERYAGVPVSEAGRLEGTAAALLVAVRWNLVMCEMERALYRDPGQDLDSLWWDLVERFQRVRRPEGRAAPDWASKIHFSVAPVYYQNYLLGEMMASQLQRAVLRDVAGGSSEPWREYVTSPRTGEWLRERLYATGRSLDWRATVRRASGDPLGVAAMVADLTRDSA